MVSVRRRLAIWNVKKLSLRVNMALFQNDSKQKSEFPKISSDHPTRKFGARVNRFSAHCNLNLDLYNKNANLFFSFLSFCYFSLSFQPIINMMKSNWLLVLFSFLMVTARAFQLEEAVYRSGMPKNIVFGAVVPGSSHVTWVLRFLDELAQRGHNVTFITVVSYFPPQKKWAELRNLIGSSFFLYLGRKP